MALVLTIAILVFLAFASVVLVWEGLAVGVGRRHVAGERDLWRVRFRFMVGLIVFATVLWIAIGILTRAR